MDDPEYQRARRRVTRRLWLQASFYFDLAFFVLVMLAILTDTKSTGDNLIGAAVFTVLWGAILVGHSHLAFNWLGGVIDRATRKEMERSWSDEKPKRHDLALSDDGELVEITADDEADDMSTRSRQR
ncbi:MAG: hypothetical protein IT320_04380 [Anaerolineae bacterium]|nr:hypothetical protein [Anaerolineae bacterium]